MEQNTVANAPIVEAPAQADVAQDTVVYAADLLKPAEPTKTEAAQTPTTPPPEKPKAPVKTQEEIDRGVALRLQDAERKAKQKAESTPEYLAGKIAIDARAAKDGITREEAAKRIQQEYEQQENQRLAENPAEFVKTIKGLLPTTEPKPEAQTNAPPTQEQFVQETKALLGEAVEAGLIPAGTPITPEMIAAIYTNRSNPVRLAAELSKLRAATPVETDADADAQPKRNNAPIRTTGENARTVEKDWRDVPDDDFKKVVEEAKERARNGEKVLF